MFLKSEAWKPAIAEKLTKLVKETQLSFADIATALNKEFETSFSRNAVIGKAKRLGAVRVTPNLFGHKRPFAKNTDAKGLRTTPFRAPRQTCAAPSSPPPAPPPPEEPVQPAEEIPDHASYNARGPTIQGIAIDALNGDTCRWPLGGVQDRPPYQYCGCQTLTNLPYCAAHMRRAMGVPRPRRERA